MAHFSFISWFVVCQNKWHFLFPMPRKHTYTLSSSCHVEHGGNSAKFLCFFSPSHMLVVNVNKKLYSYISYICHIYRKYIVRLYTRNRNVFDEYCTFYAGLGMEFYWWNLLKIWIDWLKSVFWWNSCLKIFLRGM